MTYYVAYQDRISHETNEPVHPSEWITVHASSPPKAAEVGVVQSAEAMRLHRNGAPYWALVVTDWLSTSTFYVIGYLFQPVKERHSA